ncbi:MAG TPA: hypothetical protein VGC14_25270 [Rhizobium sp.]
MSRVAFRQADIERIIRAADRQGAAVQIDIRSLVVTVIPGIHKADYIDANAGRPRILPLGNLAPDGEENFED